MPRIDTSVGSLHVEERGVGEVLFCWPSLFCDARTLEPLAADLGRDHRVIVIDGPGHGRSAAREGTLSLDDCAIAAVEVLDKLGVDRAVWIGAAWGGHVGVVAASRYPRRFPALVTMNAPMDAWKGKRRALYQLSWLGLTLTGRRGRFARAIAKAQIAHEVRIAQPDRVDTILDCMRSSDRRAFMRTVRAMMLERPTLLPVLPTVRVPTLFLTGGEDALYSVEQARREAAQIPNAEFEVVPKTAHQSAWEAPERVVPLVRSFIARLPAHAERSESVGSNSKPHDIVDRR